MVIHKQSKRCDLIDDAAGLSLVLSFLISEHLSLHASSTPTVPSRRGSAPSLERPGLSLQGRCAVAKGSRHVTTLARLQQSQADAEDIGLSRRSSPYQKVDDIKCGIYTHKGQSITLRPLKYHPHDSNTSVPSSWYFRSCHISFSSNPLSKSPLSDFVMSSLM